MGSYRIVEARLLDMFPHTTHAEVVVRLTRTLPSDRG
jgi:23S rRNA (uracil747-C5)-methyltransferase